LASYERGLRGRGNFGVLITDQDSAFAGSYHLAEDVWLPPRTPVRSIAAGVVRYSDFSPSWKDHDGRIHWNLGNVIVLEHALAPPIDGLASVCSVYVHLGADRRVKTGDTVTAGQVIGTIGRDRSEENGLYPAHLHFGIHKGPYLQISPAWRRNLEEEAKTTGIAAGPGEPIRGEIEIVPATDDSVVIKSKADGRKCILSLLVGSTAPNARPADIAAWCSGYGDQGTVDEWLRPSGWLADRMKKDGDSSPPRGRKP
jgi:murein DD-endopeptidase MepM/ murein hydrolase activator NlpD